MKKPLTRLQQLRAAREPVFPYETYEGIPSETVPDQVQALQTLLERRNNGVQPPFFNGSWANLESEDINKMDFVAIAELRELNAQTIDQLQSDYHALTHKLNELQSKSSKEDAPPGQGQSPASGANPPPEEV